MLLDIYFVGPEVADVAVLSVADGSDRVRRAFGNIVVHPVNEFAMRRPLPQQYSQETAAVIDILGHVAAGRFDECRQNVGVLNQSIAALSRRDPARPSRDQRRVQARIPIRPLAPGELAALLRCKDHERIIGLPGLLQHLENLADLPVHISDLGQVAREVLACTRRIGDVRRQLHLLRRIFRRIAHYPRHVRLDQRHDETERLIAVFGHKTAYACEVVRPGRIADAVRVESFYAGERKSLFRKDVHLAGKTYTVA